MKLLVVCSSLDLKAPFSATPAWWQLLKGLYEVGVSLVVTAYHGQVPETPWWRAYPNPARLEGDLYTVAQYAFDKTIAPLLGRREKNEVRNLSQIVVSYMAHAVIARRWQHHMAKVIKAEPDIDAALLICVPPNHLRGLANFIRQEFGIPVLFYDGDVPASLPHLQGYATGFRIYQGADIAEFDAVLSNSLGGVDAIRRLGARATHTLYYAADPQIYQSIPIHQDIDVFFYGTSAEYRADWLRTMITLPSQALSDARFVVRGRSLGNLGRATIRPILSFSHLREYVSRSKINLVISRETHAQTYGSSTMRLFELAMMGACIVCNPCSGIEEWFEPGKELLVVSSPEEAVDCYRFLLTHDEERRRLGRATRRRAVAEHTYQHRARQLVDIVRMYI